MSAKPFDPTKPCKMRGHPDKVRILCTDGNFKARGPILALATDPVNGKEYELYRGADGTYNSGYKDYGESARDLVNIPERVEKFINVYPAVGGAIRKSLKESNDFRTEDAVGIIKLIYEDDKLAGCELVENS